jgi:hypothetical protein
MIQRLATVQEAQELATAKVVVHLLVEESETHPETDTNEAKSREINIVLE